MPSVAAIEADRGAQTTRYAIPEDRPVLYEWVPGDTSTIDSLNVLGHTGGTTGRWIARQALEGVTPDKGSNLTNADETLTWTLFTKWRVLPASTLTANRTKTLSATGVTAGARLDITREDVTNFTMPIVNGGVGGGTIFTFPASVLFAAQFYFDGTNWSRRWAAQMEYIP